MPEGRNPGQDFEWLTITYNVQPHEISPRQAFALLQTHSHMMKIKYKLFNERGKKKDFADMVVHTILIPALERQRTV